MLFVGFSPMFLELSCVGICPFQIMKTAVACLFSKPAVLQTHLGVILFNSLCGGCTETLTGIPVCLLEAVLCP